MIDRLVDFNPRSAGEARPLRSMPLNRFVASVRRDLLWLLNTRTSIPRDVYDNRELTVVDYGIPDFGSVWPASPMDQYDFAMRIARAISYFEPRLKSVSVAFKPVMPDEKSLEMISNIEADLVVENIREPFSFATVLDKKAGKWEGHENYE